MSNQTNVEPNFKIRIISRHLGMSGKNVVFIDEEFFGLKPGEKIIQIGNGKENGTIRTDVFAYPVTYCGAIICQFKLPEKMYAFLLPEKDNDQDIYLLYGSTGLQIFTESLMAMKSKHTGGITSYVRCYDPQFIRVN